MKFGESIDILETLLLTDKYKSPNENFLKNLYETHSSNKQTKSKSNKGKIELEEIDKKIIYNLGQNSKQRLTKIAYDLNINPDVIKYRIDKLKKNNIITGFSAVIDGNKFEKIWCVVLININEEVIEEFKKYLKNNNNLTNYSQTIGPHNFNFTLSANSIFNLYENLNEIRTQYSEYIRDFDFQINFDFFKYPKLPKCLLE